MGNERPSCAVKGVRKWDGGSLVGNSNEGSATRGSLRLTDTVRIIWTRSRVPGKTVPVPTNHKMESYANLKPKNKFVTMVEGSLAFAKCGPSTESVQKVHDPDDDRHAVENCGLEDVPCEAESSCVS